MNYLKHINYADMKFIVNSSGVDTDFIELKDPVPFLIVLKILKY